MPKSVLQAVFGRIQFTLHATRRTPHGALRLVQAMSAWLVNTRSAPSRHGRDARVYGRTTTAKHKLSTPPPQTLLPAPHPLPHFPLPSPLPPSSPPTPPSSLTFPPFALSPAQPSPPPFPSEIRLNSPLPRPWRPASSSHF